MLSRLTYRYIGIFLLYAWVAIALMSPLASDDYVPRIYDIYNHLAAIAQAKMALTQGQFPLRIAPLEQDGWFYPLYQFYSTTSYTFAGLIYKCLPVAKLFLAYKLTLICALILGAVYIYRLVNWFMGAPLIAVLAGMFYITTPYMIILIDHLAAFNELIGLNLLPVALYYTLVFYCEPPTLKRFLLAAFFWYVLATTHLIVFLYSSMAVTILLCVLTLRKEQSWIKLIYTGAIFVFCGLLATWYLVPIIKFSPYFVVGRTFASTDLMFSHAPLLAQMLSPGLNNFSGNVFLEGNVIDLITQVHPSLGLPLLVTLGVVWYLWMTGQQMTEQRAKRWLMPLISIFAVMFVLAWSPFNFWQWLPKPLLVLQYSWRLVGMSLWIGALLFAIAVKWLVKDRFDARYLVIGIVLLMISISGWVPVLQRDTESIAPFLSAPKFKFIANAYLLDAPLNRQLATVVNDVMPQNLITVTVSGDVELKFNNRYLFREKLLKYNEKPSLLVHGTVPAYTGMDGMKIEARVGDVVLSSYALKSGDMLWRIPLASLKKMKEDKARFFQFVLVDKHQKVIANPAMAIALKSLSYEGFLDPTTIVRAASFAAHCQSGVNSKSCKVAVPQTARLLELPAMYYPNMYTVTLNGQQIPYSSLMSGNKLTLVVQPKPGQDNIIKIQFHGLLGANFVSALAWGFWLLLSVYAVLNSLFYRREIKN